ncbi:MAG: PEP-CTERM sorting domain-containing protein [Pirellulales bacterium]|nr:PEP-CTERM sorting domain-containing protein [Pirellulales bacterium]
MNGQSLSLGPAEFSAILQPGPNGMIFIIGNNVGTASGQMIIDNVQLTPIPEPGSATLLSIGGAVAVLTVLRRKQRRLNAA